MEFLEGVSVSITHWNTEFLLLTRIQPSRTLRSRGTFFGVSVMVSVSSFVGLFRPNTVATEFVLDPSVRPVRMGLGPLSS